LALELFFYPAVLCQLNGIELPQPFYEKLKKMFDFVLYVLKPNGRMPQIGDNDNGRLHVLGKRDILDMTYLLTFATLYYNDVAYKIEEFGFAPEALWVFGPEAWERWVKLPGRSVDVLESRAFPDGGIYVMRHKKDYMVISCGPNGQEGQGNHAHNDNLSFELHVAGRPVIVDPGTYTYAADPPVRNLFRSTAYHNTACVDGEEQNSFVERQLFQLHPEADVRVIAWESTANWDYLDADHSGYVRLAQPAVHRRRVLFVKTEPALWVVQDLLLGDGVHELDLRFHFAEGLAPTPGPDLSLVVEVGEVTVCLYPVNTQGVSLELMEGWVSPRYGVKYPAWVVSYQGMVVLPWSLCTFLCQCARGEDPVTAVARAQRSQAFRQFLVGPRNVVGDER